jgi:hypothetical protein
MQTLQRYMGLFRTLYRPRIKKTRILKVQNTGTDLVHFFNYDRNYNTSFLGKNANTALRDTDTKKVC